MPSTILTATAAATFISSLGVNTHLDFQAYGYQNLTTTEQAIEYLGIKNLRDSGQYATDTNIWSQVSQATGAKFDDYMPEGSTAAVQNTLKVASSLAATGALNFLEGANEEDDSGAVAVGDSLAWAAQFQHTVYSTGQSLGLPVINMSFGAGWTATNNWQGDYAVEGDLSAYCNYGNAHTYPGTNQTADSIVQRLNGLAKMAAESRPVITTELGWNLSAGFTQTDVAQYVVQGALDGWKDGDTKTYFYALFDDGSGGYGLMNSTGTSRPAGAALHNLTTLLADSATPSSLGSLSYTLTGAKGAESTLLLQKSDGSYWLAIWDESDSSHAVTLALGSTASQILVYDPVTGTNATQTVNNATSVNLTLNGDPLLLKVTSSGSSGSSGSGSSSNDLSVVVPGAETVVIGNTLAVGGVSINDAWAANHPGTMALNLSTANGAVLNANGKTVSGVITGTLAQLNADLATLSYKASSVGTDSIRINVWNQGGIQTTQQVSVTVTSH